MNRSLTYSANLRGNSYRHCFISIPHHWRAFISPASVPTFTIESISNSIVVSWAGHTHDQSSDEEVTVCINDKFLKANGFSDGEAVIIRQIPGPSACTNASMTVLSDTDWEELVLNVDVAQNAFLTQFRVIKNDQIFPLWLEGGLLIYLKVNSHKSSTSVTLLQSNTQVQVMPFSEGSSSVPLAIKPSTREEVVKKVAMKDGKINILKFLYTIFILLGYNYKNLKMYPKKELFLCLKVINFSPPFNAQQHMLLKLLSRHPSLILVSALNLKTTKWETVSHFVGKIYLSKNNNSEKTHDKSSRTKPETIMAVVMVWEKLKSLVGLDSLLVKDIDIMLYHKTCLLSNSLRRKLGINKNCMIILESCDLPIKNKNLQVDVDLLDCDNKDEKVVVSAVSSALIEMSDACPIIINDLISMYVYLEGKFVNAVITTRDGNPMLLDKENISLLNIHQDSMLKNRLADNYISNEVATFIKSFNENIIFNEKMFCELFDTINRDLNLELNNQCIYPQFILLQGLKGSGKTTMINCLVNKLSEYPYFVHCNIISLKLLKGKKVESVQKLMKTAISDALIYKPSLLVLDDLDFLTHLNSSEEKGATYEYVRHMAFMVKNLLNQLTDNSKDNSRNFSVSFVDSVIVVATCILRNDVHSFLSSPKGNHIFPKSMNILPLSEEQKLVFLQSCLEEKFKVFERENNIAHQSLESTNNMCKFRKENLMLKLDNLTFIDIQNLAHRIFLEAKTRWQVGSKFSESLLDIDRNIHWGYDDIDVQKASNGFISSSMKALNIQSKCEIVKKIGGLYNAHQLLEEMILWPSKYPQLFCQTSLRLRSGILLYGPPGCGKTLLAKSFEHYPHLGFITVKGPELLSKYIGQSEKAVRDAFERAESAKPCVLFFDEFESIAPRRGHDNTGVTDRVVNQLLTQMDGVEGLSGVYVVAATSRPDLIDPALLRPGRLDKGIYCPIPDESEREEILNILSEDLQIDNAIDFKNIAKRTEGYTGADLQSLLSTSLVKAAQKRIGKSLYETILSDSEIEFCSKDMQTSDINEIHTHTNTDDESLVCITVDHILMALNEIQPSVGERERIKYEALNKKFSHDKDGKYFAEVKPGKKETLA